MLWGGSGLRVWRGGTEKGSGDGERWKGIPLLIFLSRNCPNPPLPFFAPATQAKELLVGMSCETIGRTFS